LPLVIFSIVVCSTVAIRLSAYHGTVHSWGIMLLLLIALMV